MAAARRDGRPAQSTGLSSGAASVAACGNGFSHAAVAASVEAVAGEFDETRRAEVVTRAATSDFVVEDVECRCESRHWSLPEQAGAYALVFVRRGCFYRRVNGAEAFVDPTVVYFERPSDEQQIAHPAGGDSCTAIYVSAALVASVRGGEPGLPARPVPTSAGLDLRQRFLRALLAHRPEEAELGDLIVGVLADLLEAGEPKRVGAGRPATALARRRVVDATREALGENPRAGVVELGRRVAVSPHHLSRVFKAETGETISRYRNRLRVRLALERLADGEPCLTRLAAELGFSDQAHLTRVVCNELGTPPAQLRARLVVD
jgi:AraC-like DNA-binding protein